MEVASSRLASVASVASAPVFLRGQAMAVTLAVLTLLLLVGQLLPTHPFFAVKEYYLAMHTSLEFVAMAVSGMVFALAWSVRHQGDNSDVLLLGVGFLGVALIDVGHTLSFSGMPDLVTPSGPAKAINFWLAGRFLSALIFLAIALLPSRQWSERVAWSLVAAVLALAGLVWWVGLFHADWLPDTFIPGSGLTPFKVNAEYLLGIMYGLSAFILYRKGRRDGNANLYWLAGAAWVQGLAEMYFTLYMQVTDLFNFLGHVYKAIAYYMIYQAIFVARVRAPFEELARERAMLHNITRTQQLLVERLGLQSASLEAAVNAIVITDTQGIIEWANPAYARLTGYRMDEIIGRNHRDLVRSGVQDNTFYADMWRTIMAGEVWESEIVNRRKDGTRYTELATITPLRDPKGQIHHFVGIKQDITERKRMEQALADERAHLEERVRSRTAELEAAKVAAEMASRAKGSFLANMSHEIRTPMNAIIGMNHILRRETVDPAIQDKLAKVDKAAQHLLSIINNILDVSRIEAHRLTLDLADFDLAETLERVVTILGDRATEKGLELAMDIDPAVPTQLSGDALRLQQILINLGGNAIKFTERGSITFKVRCLSATAEDALLRFEVHDTGPGIPADKTAHIFEPFEQADGSITRNHGGTGLGLTISRELAHLMGGDIGVDSVLGQGSCFWFSARIHVGTGTAAPAALADGMPSFSGTRTKRVLVVDDLPETRLILQRLIASMNVSVDVADGCTSALQLITDAQSAGNPYEVMLIDWKMPEMNGDELARRLQAMGLEPQPRMVLVTAYGQEITNVAGSPFDAVLSKPIFPSALAEVLGLKQQNGTAAAGMNTLSALPAELRNAHVLLVEDDPINQEVAQSMLAAEGLRVEIAGNGKLALERVQAQPFDLVLMDMQMPVMDGLEATRRIRALPGMAALPIIAMTANAFAEDRRRCNEAGMNDHLAKPVDPAQLLTMLSRWLSRQAVKTAPAFPPIAADTSAGANLLQADGAPEVPPHLAALAGLDAVHGLTTTGGNVSAYTRLLRKFFQLYGDTPGKVSAAIAAGNQAEARRLAHTLKGSAATLGVTVVSTAAKALENALQEGLTHEDLNASLETAMAHATANILDVLPANGAPA